MANQILHLLMFACFVSLSYEDCGCQKNRKHSSEVEDEPASKYSAAANVQSKHTRTNDMVFIRGGEFEIGTDTPIFEADGEGPKRKVSIEDFYLDKHEVSNAEFEIFVTSTSHVTEAESFGDSFVLDGRLSEAVRSTITQAVAAAPWWLPVKGADWRHPEGIDSNIEGKHRKASRHRYLAIIAGYIKLAQPRHRYEHKLARTSYNINSDME